MVKKRLGDLLQEEVQKFTSTQDEATIQVPAEEIMEEDTSLTEELSTQAAPESTSTRRTTTATKADLEVTIRELRANLENSQQKEALLQGQVTSLQSALSDQRALVEQLNLKLQEFKQTTLQLAEQKALVERLNLELQETKQTALQLAEANSQLLEEIQGWKKVKENSQLLNYKKSHLSPIKLTTKPTETEDDFSANTWLYD